MVKEIRQKLKKLSEQSDYNPAVYFKTGKGAYAAHDQFIGVRVPDLRKLVKLYGEVGFKDLAELMQSSVNEERMLALLMLVDGYVGRERASYEFYIKYLRYVNNWNLVDVSAHKIVGAYLEDADRAKLLELVRSEDMWERRVGIIATWNYIRKGDFEWTLRLAEELLGDKEDLMHKAVGWMLREVGKVDEAELKRFLDEHASVMPRTMLRYAIERMEAGERKYYMKLGKVVEC